MNEQSKPVLSIGNNLLTGECVDLKSPLAVCEKRAVFDEKGVENGRELVVVSLIKRKLLFKTRPKPVSRDSGRAEEEERGKEGKRLKIA